MRIVRIDLDELTSAVAGKMPSVSEEEAAVALSLYRLLSEGGPVSPQKLAEASGRPEEQVRAVLESWPGVFHEGEEVIGFWGLALGPTGHGFEVGSQRLSTWCAWDALFIPELIVQRALVSSRDPVTGEEIALTVGPEAIEEASSSDVAVSFLDPSAIDFDDDVILNFCSYVHFFTSPASGLQWVAEHPATFLLTLEEAFDLGHRTNRARYGTAL
jgi:alkylmercury lyase